MKKHQEQKYRPLSYSPTKRCAALRRSALRGAEKISSCGPTERRAAPCRAAPRGALKKDELYCLS